MSKKKGETSSCTDGQGVPESGTLDDSRAGARAEQAGGDAGTMQLLQQMQQQQSQQQQQIVALLQQLNVSDTSIALGSFILASERPARIRSLLGTAK